MDERNTGGNTRNKNVARSLQEFYKQTLCNEDHVKTKTDSSEDWTLHVLERSFGISWTMGYVYHETFKRNAYKSKGYGYGSLRGTTSLKFWKFRFFLHFSIIYSFENNILKFQVEISNSFWVTAFWRAAAH